MASRIPSAKSGLHSPCAPRRCGEQPLGGTNLLLLVVLVVLENANVLLTRFTRESGRKDDRPYDINHLMLLTEATKFTLASLLEIVRTGGRIWRSIRTHTSSRDGLKVAFPAALYFVQNTLFYVALTNLPAPVFQVAYQSKLIVTAIVSALLLGRRYTASQWFSLAVLSSGVAVSVLAETDDGDRGNGNDRNNDNDRDAAHSEDMSTGGGVPPSTAPWAQNGDVTVGLVAVLAASLCSALAGVLFEKFIKQDVGEKAAAAAPSLWMRNMQLAAFSVACALSKELFEAKDDGRSAEESPFLRGFTRWVWALVALRAGTGLLVASIVRRMDNVVKGLASGVSLVLGVLASSYVFGARLSASFWIGAAMVVAAGDSFANNKGNSARGSPFLSVRTLLAVFPFALLLSSQLSLLWRDAFSIPTDQPLNTSAWIPIPDDRGRAARTKSNAATKQKPWPVPENYKEELYFHVRTKNFPDCGGCQVLSELHRTLSRSGYRTGSGRRCPTGGNVIGNRTIVLVYPEGDTKSCETKGHETIHARWILAPLGVKASKTVAQHWGEEDLVFNYATSTGTNVPISNVLQVIVNPLEGDETDISDDAFYSKNRSGIVWTMRKGKNFHKRIDYIHEQPGLNSTEFGWQNKIAVPDLRRYEYFVTYDPYTYWSWLAAMSGTVSVVYPIANVSKEEWALGTFVGSYLQHIGSTEIPGVAYGWETSELEYARATMHLLRPMLMAVKKWGANETVPRFARDAYRFKHGERSRFEGAMLKSCVYKTVC